MSRLGRALDAFWFVDGTPTRLAVLRIVLGGAALVYFGSRFDYFSRIADSSPSVFEPVGLARLLSDPIPVWLFQTLFALTIAANVAFVLGWRFGLTGPLFAVLLLWVLCYRNSWSMIYHTDNLVIFHVLILGLTRSADALSLDALKGPSLLQRLRRRAARPPDMPNPDSAPAPAEHAPPGLDPPARSWEYGYPVRLICAVTAATYLLSGIAKVVGPLGWDWAIGEGLRSQIAFDGLRKELIADGAMPLAFVVYNSLPLATTAGVGTLVLEIGAPLALLSTRLGWVWAAAVFGMHWGIYAIMGIIFWYHLTGLAFASFFIGEGLVAWCRERALTLRERLASGLAPPEREAPASEAPVPSAPISG